MRSETSEASGMEPTKEDEAVRGGVKAVVGQ